MINFTPENEYVTDTMGLVLRIEKRKLSSIAKFIFEMSESGKIIIHIPSMVFAEILYLSERKRIGISLKDVAEYLKLYTNYKEYPMNFAVIESTSEINDIGELHDRLIAGTAKFLNLHLITNDPVIQASSFVKTIW